MRSEVAGPSRVTPPAPPESNLAHIYDQMGVTSIPDWAHQVWLKHQFTGQPLIPRPTQLTGVRDALASDNHRFGLYDVAGGGKSLISYLYLTLHVGLGNKVLCLMPPKLMRQYRDNYHRIFSTGPVKPPVSIEVLDVVGDDARYDKLDEWQVDQPDVIIMSFDIFRRIGSLMTCLLDIDVVIGDEVKWLANPDNATSKILNKVIGEPGKVATLMMNGTPARNNLLNLYGYIQHTSPGTYRNIKHFKRRHVITDKFWIEVPDRKGVLRNREVEKITGYRNMGELYGALYERGRRVVIEGPEPVIELYEFDLDPKHHDLYAELVENRLLIFEDDTILDISEVPKVRHTCTQAVVDTAMLQLKDESQVIATVKEMVQDHDFEREGKILLMAYYQRTVELLLEAFADLGAVALYGKTPGKKGEANKARFLDDPDCKVMVINYESGGVGVDGLQNVCWNGIAVEPTSVPGDFQQAVKRLARPGQQRQVRITCLVATGTIYRRITVDRMQKAGAIHEVVDRDSQMTVMDLRDELLGR